MNKVMNVVDIELTKEECEILYKAEQLLTEMNKEVSNMRLHLCSTDEGMLASCLESFKDVTARYNVHVTLGVSGY